MKKVIIILAIIISFLTISKEKTESTIIIPNDSIRIRVIANSNSLSDQLEKQKIRENVQLYLQEILKNAKNKDDTELIIKNNIDNIENEVKSTLLDINSKNKYNISYGNNFFPKKEYKGKIYESGYYESLVITLGKGEGDNWWCVLFPPLCLMETEEQNMNDIEYKLFITEVLNKYK